MPLDEEINTRCAIDALNADFVWALDGGHTDRLDAIFAPNATYVSGTRKLEGLDAIREFFEQRQTATQRSTRHMYSGLRVEKVDGKIARGTSVWLSFAANSPIPTDEVNIYMVADFHDLYEAGEDGRWRILERRIQGVFRNPAAGPRGRN
ncbi:nuclear transport factor 2 family protein [Paraburkholderia domus]|uniref:nuclear transport factor 2 family protein n=1 Tax=Paraburkholderia domus TaxID=2793075 RepID=UPI001912138E|nr:nuclear transport factor 2 family protein [Paraburkholderia domus]MBK5065915.1 nuclear transport factor 2 family protein [Burkholderia sp. R-70199]CAE6959416.1 hypothetical protein R70199_07202 [Paraburkholderia domus]